ncbi:MAG: fumarylacetoacetase [Mycobacteriales bacterium]|nr:fumarylacetoacetase [Frankia sp.]
MPDASWVEVPDGSDFPISNLPYGVFSPPGGHARVGVAIGDHVVDVSVLADAKLLGTVRFDEPRLNSFLAAGPSVWADTRARLTELLSGTEHRAQVERTLHPLAQVEMHLPFEVADYVDFYSSLDHATNLGRLFRPDAEPLLPNWRHLPVGYHGRAGTVVVSGTAIRRPDGQRRAPNGDVVFGPSTKLDIEAEVGFVVGVPSRLGEPVPIDAFAEHVFGVVLVNDWSARDIQSWEYQPLGPFLGKSFATSISPWVVPLAALEAARRDPPAQNPEPLPHLRGGGAWALDITLEVELNGHVVSRPPFVSTYWTAAQQLAHLTSNGASLRTGDLYASGTVSGAGPGEQGSLIELSWNGERPLSLSDGATRSFLEDGDTVHITASAPGRAGSRIGFGDVTGSVVSRPT